MRRISTATLLTMALIAGSIELSPTTAVAQEPAAGTELDQAKALNEQAEIKFQTADYEEALVLWKQAYAMLPDTDQTRTIRNALVYNIAEAHSRAYEISRNPTHLRKAKILLENYQRDHAQLYGDEPAAVQERAEAAQRITQLEQKLADSEAKGEVATPIDSGPEPADPGVAPAPAPAPAPVPAPALTPKLQWEQDIKQDPELGPKWAKGRSQVVGGAVMTGIGSVFIIGTIGLVAWGASLRASSQNCDPDVLIDVCSGLDGTGAFVTGGVMGVIGLGLAAPGIALIAVGAKKRADVKAVRPPPVALAPYLDLRQGAGGLRATVRF